MNQIRAIQALNKKEIENGISPSASWHVDYRDTAYIYFGGLPYELTEGDVITIFSQFGEPVFLKLLRDKETGKSKGYGWLKYEDQRSTDLAVDNLGGAEIGGRLLRVDHARYKKRDDEGSEEGKIAWEDMMRKEKGAFEGTAVATETDEEEEEEEEEEGEERQRTRPLLKQEEELQLLIQKHDEDDPMKEFLIEEKKKEVEDALRKERRLEEKTNKRNYRRNRRRGEDNGSGQNSNGEDRHRRRRHKSHIDDRGDLKEDRSQERAWRERDFDNTRRRDKQDEDVRSRNREGTRDRRDRDGREITREDERKGSRSDAPCDRRDEEYDGDSGEKDWRRDGKRDENCRREREGAHRYRSSRGERR